MITLPTTFPVTSHTDFVGEGSVFVAVQGMKQDGVDFISLALERGARCIVVHESVQLPLSIEQKIQAHDIQVLRVQNTRRALAALSAQALDFPAKKLKIIGVTGTKGKTTSVFLIEHLLRSCGYKTALLSTVYNKILDTILPTQLTTQQPDYLHVFLQQCVLADIDYVVIEVAAQAVTLDRVFGIEFDALLFTNFAQEHGEFYATMEDYFAAKSALLHQRKDNAPVLINADDERCAVLLKHTHFLSFSCRTNTAQYKIFAQSCTIQGITGIFGDTQTTIPLHSPLIGEFNVYNILGALGICAALGISHQPLVSALAHFFKVPGRLELKKTPNGARCFIDYAHNPSSYACVLQALRGLTGHLIVVCGAGGDRDKQKRPLMGALAAEYADVVILTSDNPRSEDPATIIEEMVSGITLAYRHKIIIELDRELAIKTAYALSHAKSIIALLGKGPDNYQVINGQKLYFNESEIIENLK